MIELVRQVSRGDTDAFAELYDLTSRNVYGIALNLLRSPRPAATATQEIYAEVWRTAAQFDPGEGSVFAWLMSIAHRHVAERAREMRDESLADRYARLSGTDHIPAPDEGEPRREAELARRAVRALPEQQREAVTMAYFGGASQREVARVLGLPLGEAKVRIRDGLTRLRNGMGVLS